MCWRSSAGQTRPALVCKGLFAADAHFVDSTRASLAYQLMRSCAIGHSNRNRSMASVSQALVDVVLETVTAFNYSRGLRPAELRAYLAKQYPARYGPEDVSPAVGQLRREGRIEWRYFAYFLGVPPSAEGAFLSPSRNQLTGRRITLPRVRRGIGMYPATERFT